MPLLAQTASAVASIFRARDAQELDLAVGAAGGLLRLDAGGQAAPSEDRRGIAHAASIVQDAAAARAAEIAAESDLAMQRNAGLRSLCEFQRGILKWVSQGKSNAEIALILGCTKRTIDYHVLEILKKLEASSRAKAAAIFVSARARGP
ncbi:MAG: helix-turn-helix transcriptional regulator [Candidatus Kaistia colombiensis]|nr:MAG: helix-turn-helix transcriptional regulator [Kaistia sp.]